MNLNIGDKVKFLNTTGGGVISRIIDSRMVGVTVEGGFEIPTLVSELIRLDKSGAAGKFFDESFAVTIGNEQQAIPETASEMAAVGLIPHEAVKSRKSEEVLLAFVPHDQRWLITGLLDVFLYNNSSYDLIYNLYRENSSSGFTGVDYGSLTSDSKLLLKTIDREALAEWTEGTIQFLFHRETVPVVPLPFNAEFRIQGKKFFTEGNYKPSRFFEGKGIVARLMSLEKMTETSKGEGKQSSGDIFILKHKVRDREAEVDLHITELTDEKVKLEKHEILEYQKNYFRRCMESALANYFLKVTFIHGIGNGVLRQVILDELFENYKGTEVFDAPMQEYGMGAIEVRIPHNL